MLDGSLAARTAREAQVRISSRLFEEVAVETLQQFLIKGEGARWARNLVKEGDSLDVEILELVLVNLLPEEWVTVARCQYHQVTPLAIQGC